MRACQQGSSLLHLTFSCVWTLFQALHHSVHVQKNQENAMSINVGVTIEF